MRKLKRVNRAEVAYLHEVGNYSFREIGDIFGVRPRHVEKVYRRYVFWRALRRKIRS